MKVGILYPQSRAHANAGIDFVDGLKQCLKATGAHRDLELVWEGIGNGGAEKEVYQKTEHLIRIEQVDMIVAFIDLNVTPLLEPLMFSSDKLMLVVNPGANYPQNWVPQPNMLYLTLQHAFLSWLSGGLAGREANDQAAIASTFYDCGYLHGTAMLRSFMQSGGQPAHNYINNQPYNDQFELSQLLDFLGANRHVRKVLCTLDSAPAALFYDRLERSNDADGIRLFVSPMMLEAAALNSLKNGFRFSIDGYLPWHNSLDHDANTQFRVYFETQAGRPVSIFSLLGWETALVMREIVAQRVEGEATEDIIERLAAAPFQSPRGFVKLDGRTNYFTAPYVKCSAKKGDKDIKHESAGTGR